LGESDEFLVPVTLNLGLDEVTNWFNMSHVTPPVELNEIIQYFEDLARSRNAVGRKSRLQTNKSEGSHSDFRLEHRRGDTPGHVDGDPAERVSVYPCRQAPVSVFVFTYILALSARSPQWVYTLGVPTEVSSTLLYHIFTTLATGL
jgi:hypothetical protein